MPDDAPCLACGHRASQHGFDGDTCLIYGCRCTQYLILLDRAEAMGFDNPVEFPELTE